MGRSVLTTEEKRERRIKKNAESNCCPARGDWWEGEKRKKGKTFRSGVGFGRDAEKWQTREDLMRSRRLGTRWIVPTPLYASRPPLQAYGPLYWAYRLPCALVDPCT